MPRKRLSRCQRGHDLTAPGGRTKDGECRECRLERKRRRRAANPERRRESNPERRRESRRRWYAASAEKERERVRRWTRASHYGLTPEQRAVYDWLHGDACGVCGAPVAGRNRHTDHDHACCPGRRSCGKCLRGVLCRACNISIGLMGDDPARLRAAADYIESFRALADPVALAEAA